MLNDLSKINKLKDYSLENTNDYVNLFLNVFYDAPFFYTHLKRENILRYFNDLQKTPNFLGFAFYRGETLVGLCVGVLSDYFSGKTYEIKEIVVSSKLQGQGLGKQMLGQIEARLKQIDVNIITLFTSKQLDAFYFYEKNGFTSVSQTVFMSKGI